MMDTDFFRNSHRTLVVALLGATFIVGCSDDHHHGHDDHGGHDDHSTVVGHDDDHDFERGSHGGRLLRSKAFSLEITIFEAGIPPEFRVYGYVGGESIAPSEISLSIELERLGETPQAFTFTPTKEFLRSGEVVEEPHSFDVTVKAEYAGNSHRWEYASYEGRVHLTPDAAVTAGIGIATAGPAIIRNTLRVTGRIEPNEDRMAHVIPRFPGVVKEVRKRLGDPVAEGEVLAIVQSNESLELYEVRSEIAGTVIRKHVTPGEFVTENEDVYVVADLNRVWVDLNIYRQDFPRLRLGQRVSLDAGEGIPPAEGVIDYISPFGAPSTQTMLARVELPNPDGAWRPGLFVTGDVVVEETEVPIAVKATALQTIRDWTVVFAQFGDLFELRPIEIGRRDDDMVEVLSGLRAGQRYVGDNSFILKAELGKSAASHDH
jgi:cobalt-zinc-cadmium efflux system membrane fusion protein